MSRYRKLVSLIRRALGLPPIVEDLFEITVEALDPEPVTEGHPLSHRDVEHQQAQIRSATSKRVQPAPGQRSTPGVPGTSKGKPR